MMLDVVELMVGVQVLTAIASSVDDSAYSAGGDGERC